MQDGTRITYFNDSVGPTSTTYTFNVNQEMIVLRNKGSKNLSYTIGATSGVLGQGELIKVNGNFNSVILSSSQGTQAFEIISDEIGTISGSSDYTSLASQVAERIKTINGIAPDASGNITISTGSGSGSGGSTLVYSDLSALQTAYPSGTTQPAWVTSENAWYYWNGVISAPDTTPPNNVIGVNATNVTQTSMTIGWTAISDAVSYEVWKDGVLITTVSASTTYNASGLTANTSYSWVIKAKDSAGNVASGSTPLVQSTLDVVVTPPADTTPPVLTITPAATFTDTQTVVMSTNETATIYYTLDDTDPKTSGTKLTYSAPLTLTATDTIKAYARDTAGNESAVQSVTYTKQAASAGSYLQMNGTTDILKSPSITFNKVVIDAEPTGGEASKQQMLMDARPGLANSYVYRENTTHNTTWSTNISSFLVDGVAKTNFQAETIPNARKTFEINTNAVATDDINFFSRTFDNTWSMSGKIYNIKIYNGATLMAHYDMSLGNVQDQSGNNNHGVLTGGTWV